MQTGRGVFEALFERDFARLVRSLAVSDGLEQAADAVQEAFIEANRRWARVSRLEDPAGWIRRVSLNRLANTRRNHRRRTELLAAVRAPDPSQLDALDLDLLKPCGGCRPSNEGAPAFNTSGLHGR